MCSYGLPFAASRDWIVVLRVCSESCRSRCAWVLFRILLARQLESLPVYVYACVFSHRRRRVAMVRDEQDEDNIFSLRIEDGGTYPDICCAGIIKPGEAGGNIILFPSSRLLWLVLVMAMTRIWIPGTYCITAVSLYKASWYYIRPPTNYIRDPLPTMHLFLEIV